ncbi:MAG: DUF1699 family protein [Methanosarcinales archaeon]|nr:DUF1699 family protein [Methanosarcinales archaeon]
MKIRVVSSKDEISTLDSDEEIVHLAFRPSNKDIFALVNRCPGLKALHIPGSYKKTVSKSIGMFLEMQQIQLMEGDVWGHRKDINEYYEIKASILDRIRELKKEGVSEKDIHNKMTTETRLSPDLISFLIKN